MKNWNTSVVSEAFSKGHISCSSVTPPFSYLELFTTFLSSAVNDGNQGCFRYNVTASEEEVGRYRVL